MKRNEMITLIDRTLYMEGIENSHVLAAEILEIVEAAGMYPPDRWSNEGDCLLVNGSQNENRR